MTAQLDNGRLMYHPEIKVIDNNDKSKLNVKQDFQEVNIEIAQSCKDCIFSGAKNNKQTGCSIGRLQQFSKTANIVWVRKKYHEAASLYSTNPELFSEPLSLKQVNQYVLVIYHDGELIDIGDFVDEPNQLKETKYAIINDRYCNLYHNKFSDWAKNLSTDQAISKARAEIALKVSALIYFDSTHTVEMLRTSIQSCLDQQLKPVQIVVLNNQNDIAVSEVLKQMLVEYPGITWTNSRSLWGDGDIGLCVDDVLSQDLIVGAHFLLIHSGVTLKPDLISKLDVSLNDKLERWMCLTGGDILVVQTKLARVLDGFQEVKPAEHDQFIYGLENKIKWFAEKTGKPHFVKELADVVQ